MFKLHYTHPCWLAVGRGNSTERTELDRTRPALLLAARRRPSKRLTLPESLAARPEEITRTSMLDHFSERWGWGGQRNAEGGEGRRQEGEGRRGRGSDHNVHTVERWWETVLGG